MNSLHSTLKKLVHQTETEAASADAGILRPAFHLSPPTGWLNDPNGLCEFAGTYHMFFQYSPFDAGGGLKFWGHSISADLLNWEYQGVALLPDQPYDCHGVYSGSALTDDGIIDIYYTGNVKESGDFDYIIEGRQGNTVHVSSTDGVTFVNKKCILTNADYPEDCTCHIRDPKVWKEDNRYYMLLGSRKKDNKGEVLLYTSADKENWSLKNRLTTLMPLGYMWECPDLFTLNGFTYLSVSPQGMEHEDFRFQNIYQSGYFNLRGDYKSEYCLETFEEWDYGFDFYAPQTFMDESGRRILIGWMGMPDMPQFQNPTITEGWQHCMTLPRELISVNGKLKQKPIEEVNALFCTKSPVKPGLIYNCGPEWKADIFNPGSKDFELILSDDLRISFSAGLRTVSMEFTGSSGAGRTIRRLKLSECLSLTVFSDHSCIECFFNGGERVMSTRFYPHKPETISILAAEDLKTELFHRDETDLLQFH